MTLFTVNSETNILLQTLTQAEKIQAIRRFGESFIGEPAFIFISIAALLILTLTLILVSYNQKQKNLRASNELFAAYADQRGLSRRERQLLSEIAKRANLKRNESIFTLSEAFNRGTVRLTDEFTASNSTRRNRRLNSELTILREKLGFEQRVLDTSGSAVKSNKPGSRQIPAGKKIQVKTYGDSRPDYIDATVIKNDDVEIALKLSSSFEAETGDLCCVRYDFGSSVWEFDSSVLSCHGGILILTHTYDVRFINRRRFMRVPVQKPAFIASFPFARTFPVNDGNSVWAEQGSSNEAAVPWGPPEFVAGQLTELAGPGLRIEAPLKVEVGDRVVVILKVSEKTPQTQADPSKTTSRKNIDQASSRIVEDVGEVRHVETTKDGFSIAVELTGLSDSNVNELVRETNSASFIANTDRRRDKVVIEGHSSDIAEFAEQVTV